MSEFIKDAEARMQKTIEFVKSDFASVRAGRANASVLDRIQVEYYGTPTPLNQVASISSPDPRQLVVQPWDSSLLRAIEKAIQTSELGINPQNDGKVIRLTFPQLTEERRRELTKQVQQVRRGRQSGRAEHPPGRDGQDQGGKEEERDHRGRRGRTWRRSSRMPRTSISRSWTS